MDGATIKPGQILAGKYQVERVLGQGGMGVVLAARHLFMGRPVAIKLMTAVGMGSAEQEARFLREARIAGMLKGAHAGKVWDCGKLEDGSPFIEMELLEGQDLSGVLKLRGAMTIEEAVSYVLEASEAVAEAHALGIIHRDLKPANLFLAQVPGSKDRIKVLDFGISKLAADDGLTKTEQMFGSPQYMSPEQIQSSKHVDARTDVWALGVILYELLSETTPFKEGTHVATMSHVLFHAPTPLAALRPDLPPEFVAVVMRCLDKNPAMRFQSVPDLAAALGPFAPPDMQRSVQHVANAARVKRAAGPPAPAASGVETAQAMTPPIAGGGAALATGSGLMRAAAGPEAPRRRIGTVAAVAATLVVATIAVAAVTKGRGDGSITPAASTSAAPTPAALAPTTMPRPETAAPASKVAMPPAATASASAGAVAVAPSSTVPTTPAAAPAGKPPAQSARPTPAPAPTKPAKNLYDQ